MASSSDKMLALSIEQVFNAGKRAGAFEHHQKMLELLQSIAPAEPEPEEEEGEAPSRRFRIRTRQPEKPGYGYVSGALRMAVKENADRGGILPRDVPEFCKQHGIDVSMDQVRYGLKAIIKRREIRVLDSGKLVPGPAMGGKAGASAPVPD